MSFTQLVKLQPSSLGGVEQFGHAVSVDGNYVVVGSNYTNGKGAIYIFTTSNNGTTWVQKHSRVGTSNNDYLSSYGVSVDGNYVIFGARGKDPGFNGAAYILTTNNSGENWSETELNRPTILSGGDEQFGYSVAVNGNYAIVSAPAYSSYRGIVFIYERDSNGNWGNGIALRPSDSKTAHEFGYSLAINGNYAIVGASGDDGSPPFTKGAAYIFERDSNGNWGAAVSGQTYRKETVKLIASDLESRDRFGYHEGVAIDGNYVIVSSIGDDDKGTNAGAAYIFERDSNGNWGTAVSGQTYRKENVKLVSSNNTDNQKFGNSVSIKGNYAFVGAPGINSSFVYNRDSNGNWGAAVSGQTYRKETTIVTESNLDTGDNYGTSVAINTDYAVVGAHYDDDGGTNKGSIYIYSLPPPLPIFSSAVIEEASPTNITITFDKNIANNANINSGDFAVTVDSSSATISSASISSGKVILVLNTRVFSGKTITVAYTKSGTTSQNLVDTEGFALNTFTAQSVTNSTSTADPITRANNAATAAGVTNVARVNKLKATVTTTTVGGKKRADKTSQVFIDAVTALKAEIATGSGTGASSKKSKRRAVLKLIFSNNSDVVQIPMKTTDLALPTTFKKTNVVVVKAGETIDVGAIESESNIQDVGFYTTLEDGENITLTIKGKTFIVKRQDNSGERYVIDNSGGAVFTEVSGCDNWDNTLPHLGYMVDGDVFTAEGHTFFIGSVGDGGGSSAGGGGGSSGGDPYVNPMKGSTYKFPNKEAYYRLYEKDDIFINGSVKRISKERKKFIQEYFKFNNNEINPIVEDGYFYSSYYISVGDKEFVMDLKNFVFLTSKNAKNFFNFKMTNENVKGTWDNGKALCLNVSWEHHKYGTMSLDILKYENPQIDSMIRMKRYPSIENTVGALVRNYKPKLMEIEKLDSTKAGKIAKKLKKAKNKFTNKAYMQKGETWTINGKIFNFSNINEKI